MYSEIHKIYVNNDVRIPNICFNESLEIVLIDFDKASLDRRDVNGNLAVFAKDLIEFSKANWNDSSLSWICKDRFLSRLMQEEWNHT